MLELQWGFPPVDPCYRRLHHRQGAKIVFYGLDQQIFWSSLIKAQHKVIFGCQFRPLPDFAEFRETLKCAPALGLVLEGRGGWWPGRMPVKHSCGKRQAAPCGAQTDVALCFLQEQAPSGSGREPPWATALWFNEWGSVRLPGQWACCGERGIAELLEKGRILVKSTGVRAARKVLDALY